MVEQITLMVSANSGCIYEFRSLQSDVPFESYINIKGVTILILRLHAMIMDSLGYCIPQIADTSFLKSSINKFLAKIVLIVCCKNWQNLFSTKEKKSHLVGM